MSKVQSKVHEFGGFGAQTLKRMFTCPRIHDVESIAESVARLPEMVLPLSPTSGCFALASNGRVVAAGVSSDVYKGVYRRFGTVDFDEIWAYMGGDADALEIRRLIGGVVPLEWEQIDVPYLPVFPGVYVLFCDDAPVYCGQSENVQVRICDHLYSNYSRTKGKFDSAKVMEIQSLEVRNIVEGCLIYAIKPPLSQWLGTTDRHDRIVFERNPNRWRVTNNPIPKPCRCLPLGIEVG